MPLSATPPKPTNPEGHRMTLPESFPAFLAAKQDTTVERGPATFHAVDLPEGDVTIRVAFSSLNYKDALATIPKGGVARISPLVPGIDLAGEVVASDAPEVAVGDRVVVTGFGLGVSHHGGWAQYARVPSAWVVPLPDGLDGRQAMALGTAGILGRGLDDAIVREVGLDGIVPVLDALLAGEAVGRTVVRLP